MKDTWSERKQWKWDTVRKPKNSKRSANCPRGEIDTGFWGANGHPMKLQGHRGHEGVVTKATRVSSRTTIFLRNGHGQQGIERSNEMFE